MWRIALIARFIKLTHDVLLENRGAYRIPNRRTDCYGQHTADELPGSELIESYVRASPAVIVHRRIV